MDKDLYIKPKFKKEIKCMLVSAVEYGKLKEENAQLKEECKHLEEANFINLTEASKLADKEHKYLSEIRQLKEAMFYTLMIIAITQQHCGKF